MFKECETNYSYNNSTIGLNLYTIKDINNFALIDSPGDTEINDSLELFASKGYLYSKLFVYLINEENNLDKDDMTNNKNLNKLIGLRNKYKISLLILLTHSDNYCDKVKKENNNWKQICKENIENNKKNILKYINEIIVKGYKSDFKMEENNILHIVLVEPEKNQMTYEEKYSNLPGDLKEKYKNYNEEMKKIVIDAYYEGRNSKENEVKNFIKEMNILGPKELIETIKDKLPSQFHDALN